MTDPFAEFNAGTARARQGYWDDPFAAARVMAFGALRGRVSAGRLTPESYAEDALEVHELMDPPNNPTTTRSTT